VAGDGQNPAWSRTRSGFTAMELMVAMVAGMVVTGAALALVASGNRIAGDLVRQEDEWQRVRAAAVLWAAEWRGAGYDPTGTAGAGVTRLAPGSLDFSADWNGSGALVPTSGNPNERLSWTAAHGVWRRGVNGGSRVAIAWPESIRYAFRTASGAPLAERPPLSAARIAEVRVRAPLDRAPAGRWVTWIAARRNP